MILDKASGCLELVDDAINFKGIKFDMIKWNSIKVEN